MAPARVARGDSAAILDRVNRRGRVYLSNATVRGSFVLRACITNHRTTDDDVAAVVDEVIAAASELCSAERLDAMGSRTTSPWRKPPPTGCSRLRS